MQRQSRLLPPHRRGQHAGLRGLPVPGQYRQGQLGYQVRGGKVLYQVEQICDFSELCQFSAGVLPARCVYTHWHLGKTAKGQSPEYSKIFEKNTIFNKHPVCQGSTSSSLSKSFILSRGVKSQFFFIRYDIIYLHIICILFISYI